MEILYSWDLWNVVEKGCKLIQSNGESEKGVCTSAKNELLESKVRLTKYYNTKVIIFNTLTTFVILILKSAITYHNKRYVGYACTNVIFGVALVSITPNTKLQH